MPVLAKKVVEESVPTSTKYLQRLRAKKDKPATILQSTEILGNSIYGTYQSGAINLVSGSTSAITVGSSGLVSYPWGTDANHGIYVQRALQYAAQHANDWADTDTQTANTIDTDVLNNVNETARQSVLRAANYFTLNSMGTSATTNTVSFNVNTGTAGGMGAYSWVVNSGLLVPDEDQSPILNQHGKPIRSLHKDKQFADVNPSEMVALQLLRKMIPQDDFRHYLRHGFVNVRGDSGLVYQVRRDSTILVWEQGEQVASLCVHLKLDSDESGSFRSAPPTDHVVGKMLIIECDEDAIWKRSNITWLTKDRTTKPLERLGLAV